MRTNTILLLLFVIYLVLSEGKFARRIKSCPSACPYTIEPVCATLKRGAKVSVCTFDNMCLLKMHICKSRLNWRMETNEPCQWRTEDCEDIFRFHRPTFVMEKLSNHAKDLAHNGNSGDSSSPTITPFPASATESRLLRSRRNTEIMKNLQKS